MNKEPEIDQEYYLSTKDSRGDFLIYKSESFRLSEIDIINLIKICLIEIRSKSIGKKILAVYRDSNQHRKLVITENLKKIGISEEEDKNPIKLNKRTKTI